jgi:MurNAc alpha-1-phosphate uridylyltransferase
MKAMILAAGRGSRMRELTDHMPKPLVRVLDKPLIQYHLDNLQQAGFKDVVVNVSWLAEQLESYLEDEYRGALNITIYKEPQALETGGGVLSALEFLSGDNQPFLVINADVMTDFDYSMVKLELDSLAHLYLVENPAHHLQGDFVLAPDQQLSMPSSINQQTLTFSGVSVLTPALFSQSKLEKFSLGDLFRKYMKEGLISGEQIYNKWIDVGTVERLEQAAQWQQTLKIN